MDKQNVAWEGASFSDKVSGAKSAAEGKPGYFQLQRRFTNPRIANPWANQ